MRCSAAAPVLAARRSARRATRGRAVVCLPSAQSSLACSSRQAAPGLCSRAARSALQTQACPCRPAQAAQRWSARGADERRAPVPTAAQLCAPLTAAGRAASKQARRGALTRRPGWLPSPGRAAGGSGPLPAGLPCAPAWPAGAGQLPPALAAPGPLRAWPAGSGWALPGRTSPPRLQWRTQPQLGAGPRPHQVTAVVGSRQGCGSCVYMQCMCLAPGPHLQLS